MATIFLNFSYFCDKVSNPGHSRSQCIAGAVLKIWSSFLHMPSSSVPYPIPYIKGMIPKLPACKTHTPATAHYLFYYILKMGNSMDYVKLEKICS